MNFIENCVIHIALLFHPRYVAKDRNLNREGSIAVHMCVVSYFRVLHMGHSGDGLCEASTLCFICFELN